MERQDDLVPGLDPVPTRLEDPPGLDAAIEAAANAMRNGNSPAIWIHPQIVPMDALAALAVRAAAPALRAGALRDAADEYDERIATERVKLAKMHLLDEIRELVTWRINSLHHEQRWLRERADRIGGAT